MLIYREGTANTADVWVEEVLDPPWVAAYRIAAQDGRPFVAEVRVFPRAKDWVPKPEPEEGDTHYPPGEWEGGTAGTAAPVPPGGLPATILRRVRLRPVYEYLAREIDAEAHYRRAKRLHRQGLTVYAEAARRSAEIFHVEQSRLGFTDGLVRRPGRRGRPDLFYAQVAGAYVDHLARGSGAPIRDLADSLRRSSNEHFSEGYVRQLVHAARSRDMLTAAPPGRAGGALTDRARALLAGGPGAIEDKQQGRSEDE